MEQDLAVTVDANWTRVDRSQGARKYKCVYFISHQCKLYNYTENECTASIRQPAIICIPQNFECTENELTGIPQVAI